MFNIPAVANMAAAFMGSMTPATPFAAARTGHREYEGPAGANLFVLNLPLEWTDAELTTNFMAFGNVMSVKVFVDKLTGMSKGFGFVSYDNPLSAQTAIQHMNGYMVSGKQLKVELKKDTRMSGQRFSPY